MLSIALADPQRTRRQNYRGGSNPTRRAALPLRTLKADTFDLPTWRQLQFLSDSKGPTSGKIVREKAIHLPTEPFASL